MFYYCSKNKQKIRKQNTQNVIIRNICLTLKLKLEIR